MGQQIDDGKGRGFLAEVNPEQELVVRSITESEIEHASATAGNAYSWDSGIRDIDAGDTMLFVMNTGDTPLILDRLVVNGSNVICAWEILIGAETTTPSGTDVIGTNLNEIFSTKLADASAFYDETAVADGNIVDRITTGANGHHIHDLTGMILGKNHYVQINQETESTSGSVILHGHYENPS